ncbi:hypothetical protein AAY473_006986 [Plecturocebus cupreus]
MVQSWLIATSTSWVQKQGFSMLVRLVSNSRPQVIHPSQPRIMLGLQKLSNLAETSTVTLCPAPSLLNGSTKKTQTVKEMLAHCWPTLQWLPGQGPEAAKQKHLESAREGPGCAKLTRRAESAQPPPRLQPPSLTPGILQGCPCSALTTGSLSSAEQPKVLLIEQEMFLKDLSLMITAVVTMKSPSVSGVESSFRAGTTSPEGSLHTVRGFGRVRQENCLNLGGGDCSEPRSSHYTPAWAAEQDSI